MSQAAIDRVRGKPKRKGRGPLVVHGSQVKQEGGVPTDHNLRGETWKASATGKETRTWQDPRNYADGPRYHTEKGDWMPFHGPQADLDKLIRKRKHAAWGDQWESMINV